MFMRWKQAMGRALYGDDGFFRRPSAGPAAHFRTSAHASPLFAEVLAGLVVRLDEALGQPAKLDVVDIGAGGGELLTGLLDALPERVAGRVDATAVEVAARPDRLPAAIRWTAAAPAAVNGLLLATEWLDNVPLDIAEVDEAGIARYVCVDIEGNESLGAPLEPVDAAWLADWWPLEGAPPGARAEIGAPRDEAWSAAVSTVRAGLALAVDYGHFADRRPLFGSLAGFRAGRETEPVPDGSCDLTVAVALDAVAVAGARAVAVHHMIIRQDEALRALGAHGGRPPITLAAEDPAGYVRALSRAGAVAELTDPEGLGGHWWVLQWV
jgi:SAM-dependent MidA family methyltransferase